MMQPREWIRCLLIAGLASAGGCAIFKKPEAPKSLVGSEEEKRSAIARANFEEEDPVPKNEGLGLKDFSPDNIGKTAKKLVGQGPDKELAKKLYQEADTFYDEALKLEGATRAAKFTEAGRKYEEAAGRWPDSQLQQDALFKAGESAFFADRYKLANDFYEKLAKQYPNNRYMDVVDHRRFTLAQYWLGVTRKTPESWWALNFTDNERPMRDTKGHAVRVFDRIRIDDPTGRLADDATLAAGNEFFLREDYNRAEEYYSDLRKNFPTSEHQFNAHFLGLKAKLLGYRGANYAGESLDESEKLVRQMKKQFPNDAAKEKEFLDRAYAEIRYKKAEREWNRAQYHERREEFRAAYIYYDQVVNDFSDTPFGEKAKERMDQIRAKPAVAPQKLPWLVKLFPESDKVKPLIQASQDSKGGKRR